MDYECTDHEDGRNMNCTNGMWGCGLPCPSAAFGGRGVKGCSKRRPVPVKIGGEEGASYDHLTPRILNALSEGVEKTYAKIVMDRIYLDPDCPDWIKQWITCEVIPALAVSVDTIRKAAVRIGKIET